MIPLQTEPPADKRHIRDLIQRDLDEDMEKYPGLTLRVGFTEATDYMRQTTITWKIEASGRTGKTNRSKIKYLGRYRDLENGQTLTELWFDMNTDPYKFWVERQAKRVSR